MYILILLTTFSGRIHWQNISVVGIDFSHCEKMLFRKEFWPSKAIIGDALFSRVALPFPCWWFDFCSLIRKLSPPASQQRFPFAPLGLHSSSDSHLYVYVLWSLHPGVGLDRQPLGQLLTSTLWACPGKFACQKPWAGQVSFARVSKFTPSLLQRKTDNASIL